jgi:hypothetical protein
MSIQVTALAQVTVADSVPLNHIQVLGSHNSYRKPMDRNIFFALRHLDLFINQKKKSSPADQLFYSHLPFPDQFSQYGIRCLEIDIHHDPDGGLYSKHRGAWLFHNLRRSGHPELDAPGMKVLHIADIDYNTHYLTFKQSLEAVRDWLLAHPRSLPIYILVEPKEEGAGNRVGLGFTKVMPFDSLALETVDAEIAEVFKGKEHMVYRPDDLRKSFYSIRQRLDAKGWPLLHEVRGKVIFIINGNMRHTELYGSGHPSFCGRWMFSFSKPGRDDAAFIKRDGPESPDVAQLVRQGYIIRTRTDTPGDEARLNDAARREVAFRSGAQMLCTDYYRPDLRLSEYVVMLPGRRVAMHNMLSEGKYRVTDWGEDQ